MQSPAPQAKSPLVMPSLLQRLSAANQMTEPLSTSTMQLPGAQATPPTVMELPGLHTTLTPVMQLAGPQAKSSLLMPSLLQRLSAANQMTEPLANSQLSTDPLKGQHKSTVQQSLPLSSGKPLGSGSPNSGKLGLTGNKIPMPDGTGSLRYPIPNMKLFVFDPNTGYQFDPSTGLHFDANSGLFYNSQLKLSLKWDLSEQTYLSVGNTIGASLISHLSQLNSGQGFPLNNRTSIQKHPKPSAGRIYSHNQVAMPNPSFAAEYESIQGPVLSSASSEQKLILPPASVARTTCPVSQKSFHELSSNTGTDYNSELLPNNPFPKLEHPIPAIPAVKGVEMDTSEKLSKSGIKAIAFQVGSVSKKLLLKSPIVPSRWDIKPDEVSTNKFETEQSISKKEESQQSLEVSKVKINYDSERRTTPKKHLTDVRLSPGRRTLPQKEHLSRRRSPERSTIPRNQHLPRRRTPPQKRSSPRRKRSRDRSSRHREKVIQPKMDGSKDSLRSRMEFIERKRHADRKELNRLRSKRIAITQELEAIERERAAEELHSHKISTEKANTIIGVGGGDFDAESEQNIGSVDTVYDEISECIEQLLDG